MSSLQQQLTAIAANSTHQLDLRAQKTTHGKSLLFESKVAASQDFNTIYQISIDGFQELCMLDYRFSSFATTLFSEQSKEEERTEMTRDQNEALDGVVESFLSLVGPFLLLKPAIKSVEWLIRRFRIHEYNTDAVILTFLQYHTTPLFLTMLSILPKRIPETFKFLYPYISQVQNPPRQAILYTTIKSPNLFAAYSKYVIQTTDLYHSSSKLLSFWAALAVEAVNGMLDGATSGVEGIERQKQGEVFMLVLPILRDALIVKHAPDLHLACFMLITVLGVKASLADDANDGLMETVANSLIDQTVEGGLVCLAFLAEERKSSSLPKSVVRRMLKIPQLDQRLQSVTDRCHVSRLTLGLVRGILSRTPKHPSIDAVATIGSLLGANMLSAQDNRTALTGLITFAHELDQHSGVDSATKDRLSELVSSLFGTERFGDTAKSIVSEHQLDLDKIEMNLNVVIRTEAITFQDETSMEIDGDSITEDVPQFREVLANVPSTTDEMSFLGPDSYSHLEQLLPLYLQAVPSAKNVQLFFDLPTLRRDSSTTLPNLFTFLIRMWCGPYPAIARNVALQELLRNLRNSKDHGDLQILVPYLLHALADSRRKIRQSAADCLLAVNHFYQEDARPGSGTIWSADTFYGRYAFFTLGRKDAAKLLSGVVLPSLSECVLDSDRVAMLLAQAINGERPSTAGADTIKLKVEQRSSISPYLATHISNTPLLAVRRRLLSFLSSVGKVASPTRSEILVPCVRAWTAVEQSDLTEFCKEEIISIDSLLDEYLDVITPREKEGLALLEDIIDDDGSKRSSLVGAGFRRLEALWPSFKSAQQLELARTLWSNVISEDRSRGDKLRQNLSRATLTTLDLPSEVLESIVASLPDASQSSESPTTTKRRRTSHTEMAKLTLYDQEQMSSSLRQITLALELVEGSQPQKHPTLLRGLFHLLGELQQYRSITGSDLVYLQSILLGSLLSIVNSLKHTNTDNVDRSAIRADLLVECVRTTSNPQVQNLALLLTSSLAAWVPDLVLHSVMPIFTFMSTTILRQGDDYSAHVIGETVGRVIPPLVSSLRKRGQDLVTGASEILLSFTAAFEHIPFQRRLGLFTHLTKTLGPSESLFAIIALLVDRYPTDDRVRQFTMDLIQEFDQTVQVRTAIGYLGLIQDCQIPRRGVSEVVFNIKERSPENVVEMLRNLLDALATLLKGFHLTSLKKPRTSANDEEIEMYNLFAIPLRRAIELCKSMTSDGLQTSARHVLANILELLPTSELIEATTSLLDKPEDDIRRYVLRALENRVDEIKTSDSESRTAILDFLPKITNLLMESSSVPLRRSAIACIDRAAEKFGKKDPSVMISAAEAVASGRALGDEDENLQSASLFCLASIAEVTKESFVGLLPRIVPRTFECLNLSIASQNESLYDAAYALISTVTDHMPYVFSGDYIDRALRLSHNVSITRLGETSPESRRHFYQLASRRLSAREIFGALQRQWLHAVATGYHALFEHVHLLNLSLERHPKSAAIKNSEALFQILLEAFDLRRLRHADSLEDLYNLEKVATIERLINDVALALVMKLNDTIFRPFFLQLVDWASASLPKSDDIGRISRATSLFVFLETFLDRLKGIVTSYTSYILDLAVSILQGGFPEGHDAALLEAVLKTLIKSFEHDQDDFWQSTSHFSKIVAPLVRQLEVAPETLIATAVIPAITMLGVAASSTDHHKDLDTSILKLTRHDDAQVRLRAVLAQRSLTDRLGDDWLGLLPEMLPFISELQEDDDEEVEKETQRWIKSIEEVLGENLDEMLQ